MLVSTRKKKNMNNETCLLTPLRYGGGGFIAGTERVLLAFNRDIYTLPDSVYPREGTFRPMSGGVTISLSAKHVVHGLFANLELAGALSSVFC